MAFILLLDLLVLVVLLYSADTTVLTLPVSLPSFPRGSGNYINQVSRFLFMCHDM